MLDGPGRMIYAGHNGSAWRVLGADADFLPEGRLVSSPLDITVAPAFADISFEGNQPEGTGTKLFLRSSDDGEAWTAWQEAGPGAPPAQRRYLQWMAALSTARPNATPIVSAIVARFEHHRARGELELAPLELAPHQTLASISGLALFSGGGDA